MIRDTVPGMAWNVCLRKFSARGAGGLDLAEKLLRLFESEPADFRLSIRWIAR